MAFGRKKRVEPDEGEGAPAAASPKKSKDKKEEKKDDDEDKEIGPEHGPRSLRKRGCTDCCCILIFIVFGLGMAMITYLAWTYGEPLVILYGKDYLGNRCGTGDFTDRSKIIFGNIGNAC